MKTTQQRNPRTGFTLIEMVGVLAVIAILAALLVPKIFAAIEESHLNSTTGAINTIKSATMTKFSKDGVLTVDSSTNVWDVRLLIDGLLEKRPDFKIATGWGVHCVAATAGPTFNDLDGAGTAASGNVVYVGLTNVAAERALELSKRIDGPSSGGLTETSATTADTKGRVVYTDPGTPPGPVTVHVYIAHK